MLLKILPLPAPSNGITHTERVRIAAASRKPPRNGKTLMTEPENRCRLVLIVPDIADADESGKIVGDGAEGRRCRLGDRAAIRAG